VCVRAPVRRETQLVSRTRPRASYHEQGNESARATESERERARESQRRETGGRACKISPLRIRFAVGSVDLLLKVGRLVVHLE